MQEIQMEQAPFVETPTEESLTDLERARRLQDVYDRSATLVKCASWANVYEVRLNADLMGKPNDKAASEFIRAGVGALRDKLISQGLPTPDNGILFNFNGTGPASFKFLWSKKQEKQLVRELLETSDADTRAKFPKLCADLGVAAKIDFPARQA